MLKKNDLLVVDIIDLSYEAYGVAKWEGFPIFVENALAGEQVEIRIVKVLQRYAFAIVTQFIKVSEDRVEIKDRMGTKTGTTPLQHLAYPKQLEFKKKLVCDALRKHIDLSDVEVLDTIGMEEPWKYRNKAQIAVREIKGQLETGFFRRRSHDLVPIEHFYIQEDPIDELIVAVRDLMREFGISAYDEKNHKGMLRHIIVRKGHYTGELMLIFVTLGDDLAHSEKIVSRLLERYPKLVSIVQNINKEKTNVIMGSRNKVLYGEDFYHEVLLGRSFKVSSASFFQVNTRQAERLYQVAFDFAGLKEDDLVLDAYCGIGTIGLSIADRVKKVYGVEVVPDAVRMALENAELNGISNVDYRVGKAEDVIDDWRREGVSFDVVIVDPPRKGLELSFIESLLVMRPERIVYVSCNPATLARDLALLVEQGYRVERVQPVDLFGMSVHVETCVLLSHKNS